MVRGVGEERWQHTSALLAMLANTHRDPKRFRAYKPKDFDPYRQKKKKIVVTDMSVLKSAFAGRGRERNAKA